MKKWYVCMYVFMCVCIYVCMHVCMYVCIYVGMCIITYVWLHDCMTGKHIGNPFRFDTHSLPLRDEVVPPPDGSVQVCRILSKHQEMLFFNFERSGYNLRFLELTYIIAVFACCSNWFLTHNNNVIGTCNMCCGM